MNDKQKEFPGATLIIHDDVAWNEFLETLTNKHEQNNDVVDANCNVIIREVNNMTCQFTRY
jgi:hypothetical protein